MTSTGPATELLGRVAFHFSEMQPFFPMYLHLILSALFPIFTGAHASLSRPSSAAKPPKRDKTKDKTNEEDENDEDQTRMEGLSPSDAIMFPLLAGVTLSGLYFLIKWLQDAALLNKILNWYFSGFAVFSVGRLATDCLILLRGLAFPKCYLDSGVMWKIDSTERKVISQTDELEEQTRNSPLPGIFSRMALPSTANHVLWTVRDQLSQKLIVKLHVRRIVSGKLSIGTLGLLGALIGLFCVVYFNFVSRPWFLTNILGFAFAYSALQFMSPTTFGTGSLILGALFLYDIYFVFYTPMMVTVAKELDIPIKLLFPRPKPEEALPDQLNLSMLGLGDVVLPGIMIGLALRFDLYMHYLKKQERKEVVHPTPENVDSTETNHKGMEEVVKAPFTSVSGRWGDRFWSLSWPDMFLPAFARNSKTTASAASAMSFPKPYFYASVSGYVFGMCVTLVVMQIADHAQPALLYLVPGVLVSVWLTGLVRGEVKEMSKYDEMVEEEQDKKDKAKDKAKHDQDQKKTSRKSFFSTETRQKHADAIEKAMEKYVGKDDGDEATTATKYEGNENENERTKGDDERSARPNSDKNANKEFFSRNRSNELIFFSVTLPSAMVKISESESGTNGTVDGKDWNGIAPSAPDGPRVQRRQVNGEPSGKRQRVS